jgi:hypothetical protein
VPALGTEKCGQAGSSAKGLDSRHQIHSRVTARAKQINRAGRECCFQSALLPCGSAFSPSATWHFRSPIAPGAKSTLCAVLILRLATRDRLYKSEHRGSISGKRAGCKQNFETATLSMLKRRLLWAKLSGLPIIKNAIPKKNMSVIKDEAPNEAQLVGEVSNDIPRLSAKTRSVALFGFLEKGELVRAAAGEGGMSPSRNLNSRGLRLFVNNVDNGSQCCSQ